MKIGKDITVFSGETRESAGLERAREESGREEKKVRKTVYAGALQGNQTLRERIANRKEQARQQAMKIIRDAWEGDRAIDRDVEERRERRAELLEEGKAARESLEEVEKRKQELQASYGITDKTPPGEQPEEYQNMMRELEDYAGHNREILAKNQNELRAENAAIRETSLMRLKKPLMVKPKEQAEEVLEQAEDEIVGMVMEDAVERQEEEQEKREEQAQKLQEKREATEELQRKREEKQEKMEELLEETPVEEMVQLEQTRTDVRQEVQNLISQLQLTAEDIKGAMIDREI